MLQNPVNSLPNHKILAWSKFKAFADDKINEAKMMIFVFHRVEKHSEKMRKCWLPAFSPFPTMFSNSFFLRSFKVRVMW